MKLTSAVDLAAEWGMTEAELHRRRRRFGWPCVRLARSDIRFTEQQIEQIIAMQSETGAKKPKVGSSTGQTSRSARRAS